ncbi:hypothetical protein TRIP_E110015 [uncultured Spirochaetota bacterium]|uniref:Uncharacterized protein n=1 Tax=uncultured Spirochaetota bacterium TaxID=460511 RepID=A0A652ZRZ8_9SPIR|nr:hypothetical protein TRIP_E110015 [uncultured Spirochaetota bacterium]
MARIGASAEGYSLIWLRLTWTLNIVSLWPFAAHARAVPEKSRTRRESMRKEDRVNAAEALLNSISYRLGHKSPV